MKIPAALVELLPPKLVRELQLHCQISREDPLDVIVDALALHLDELDGGFETPAELGRAAP